MAKRIQIDIDSTPILQLNARLKELSAQYLLLTKNNEDLTKKVKEGALDQAAALYQNKKALNSVKLEIEQITKSTQTLNKEQPFENMAKGSKSLTSQLKDVKAEMQRLVESGDTSSEKFKELGKRSGELKVAITDTAMQMRQFEQASVSASSGVSNGFRDASSSLRSMDFTSATRGLQGLKTAMSSLDVNKIAGDFLSFSKAVGSTLVQAVKTMGKTFLSVGKALLTNPIFLLATIIIALVVAIVKLSDKVEIFGKIVKAVGAVIQWFTDLIGKFTDWLGITNNAEQDLANKRAKRFKEESERITKEGTLRQNAYNRQIQLIQAKGDLTDKEKEQVQDLTIAVLDAEEKKQWAQRKSTLAQIQALRVKGKLTDEEKEQLAELKVSYSELTEAIKDTQTNIKASRIKYNADLKKLDNEANAKSLETSKQAWEKRRAEIERQQQEEAKLRQEAIKFIADIEEKARISAIKDEDLQSLAVTLAGIEREKSEILKNTQLTEEQKLKIKEYYNALAIQANNDYKDKVIAKEKELSNEQLSLEDKFNQQKLSAHLEALKTEADKSYQAKLSYREALHTAELEALKKEQAELVLEYQKAGLDTTDLLNFQLDQRNELVRKKNEDLVQIKQEEIDRQKEMTAKQWGDTNKVIQEALSFQGDLYSSMLASIGGQLIESLGNINLLLDDEGASIGEKMVGIVQGVTAMISSILESATQLNKEKLAEQLADLDATNSQEIALVDSKLQQGLISQQEADKQKYALELAKYNQEEAIKKKSFESNKKLQIAQAGIAMLQGIVSAFTGAMQLGPIAGPIVGAALAAAVGIMGAVNIAKIKKTKYNAGTPPSPATGGLANVSVPSNLNNVSLGAENDTGMSGDNKQSEVKEIKVEQPKISVSVTEIDTVRNRVNNYEMASEL